MTSPLRGALLVVCLAVACVSLSCGFVGRETRPWPSLDHLPAALRMRNIGVEFVNHLNGSVVNQGSMRFPNASDLLLDILNDQEVDVDLTCAVHLKALVDGFGAGQQWALKVIDAWGKIPSGVLYGHIFEMGNFEECLSVDHEMAIDQHIRGKYCLANVPMGKLLNDTQLASVLNLRIGICFPDSCSAQQTDFILKLLLSQAFNVTVGTDTTLVQEGSCSTSGKESFEAIDIVAIVVLSLLGALVIASTSYDYLATHLGKAAHSVLGAFSVRVNCRQLFHTSSHRNSPHVIPCLNGIRSLSIIWIIFGHCYMLLISMPLINSIDLIGWSHTVYSMFLQSATISVDSFFFLSGLLLITVAMRQMDRSGGKINIPMMYLHRYLRLTPVLAVSVLVFMSLFRYMGSGPLWNDFNQSYKLCDTNWWATLLYVQNYAAAGKMCLGHSWYLAVDMQLYILSPLALIAIWKWKRKGVMGFLVVGLLLLAMQISIIVLEKLTVVSTLSKRVNDYEQSKFYYPTHMRTSSWIIGMAFGYFVHTRGGRRTTLPLTSVALGWLLSMAMLFTVIFALYPKTQPGASLLTPLEGAFYLSFSRIGWSLALAWIVFACMNGYGGPVNHFLSWSFWQPISKLTYCMYLSHLVVEMINAGRIKTDSYFSDYDATLRFWSDFGITVLVSLVMYLAIEAPFVGLEKHLFTTKKKPTKSEAPATATSQDDLCG